MKITAGLKNTFNSLIAMFIILVAYFAIPLPDSLTRTLFPVIALLGFVFLVQGTRLALMARKQKGKLKAYLMTTGISATLPFAGSVLHNLFYALGILYANFSALFEFLYAAFFILAILVAPVTFIIGAVGSYRYLRKA